MTTSKDRQRAESLRTSPKERAENVLIVDMVRNDLGRIAAIGSVQVPELFALERYPNVWQMTSLVTARSAANLAELFAALHPSASVTGAPKRRTMQLLATVESGPRGPYTGAIGHIAPNGDCAFSVAIRTAVVDQAQHRVDFGVGSGIVWDSTADSEYEECLLKGSVLSRRDDAFDLLETLRWTPDGGFLLLDRHFERLRDSADYFGIRYDEDVVRRTLAQATAGATGWLRVRLRVTSEGQPLVEHRPLAPDSGPLRVALADLAVDQEDRFLDHKTTYRRVYDERRKAGFDDTLLWNTRDEITESTTANVVVDIGGELVTPPVSSGLLAGTCRAEALAHGRIRERVVMVREALQSPRLWLINSVHEWRPMTLVPAERSFIESSTRA